MPVKIKGSESSKRHQWLFSKASGSVELDIGIIGAGISGLSAAAALIRLGHRVELFERSHFKNEVGAALGLSPNVTGILDAIGFSYERARAVNFAESHILESTKLKPIYQANWSHLPEKYGSKWYAFHRVDLHKELKRVTLCPGEGIKPAEIRFGAMVVGVDCDEGVLELADGTKFKKDLVIGADGIHSLLAQSMHGSNLPPTHNSGQSAYRWLVKSEKLYENPETRSAFLEPHAVMKVATSIDRRVIYYPCRDWEYFNFALLHPTAVEALEEGWQGKGEVEDLVEVCKAFDPRMIEACRMAEDLKLWTLKYRAPIRQWAKGRAILIGDAAHPMLPHQAQAANMALEDVGALARLLSNVQSLQEIPRRLEMVQEIRRDRANALQIFSNSPQDRPDQGESEIRKYYQGPLPKNSIEFADYLFGYDLLSEVEAAIEAEGMH